MELEIIISNQVFHRKKKKIELVVFVAIESANSERR